jgi:inner membrane protein
LEYHRQFTHSLIFIPVGALICALVLQPVMRIVLRKRMGFGRSYLFCFAGYATHALLDACTTYGTQLLWPFSNARIAWNNVSVVDPLFTLPLIILVFVSLVKKSRLCGVVALGYCLLYLTAGGIQNQRAKSLAQELALSRGHQPQKLGVKPSFANLLLWKSVYEHRGRYYIDAIRVGKTGKVIPGVSILKLDLGQHFLWLDATSQQARDVQRFSWFSNHHLGIDPKNPDRIIDIRYSLIPNQVDGMWGIILDRDAAANKHVIWNTTRPKGRAMERYFEQLWQMLADGE